MWLAKEIIKSGFNLSRNQLVCCSGGKDSVLMSYLILEVCEEEGLRQPYFLLSDPFPIEENKEFCKYLVKELGIKKALFMDKFVTEEGRKNFVGRTGDFKKCCLINKVELLKQVIRKFNIDLVFVAVRWDEHPARSSELYFKRMNDPPHIRCHPILHLTWYGVLNFYLDHPELLNPLYLKGYTSLGCKPCTSRTINKEFKSIKEYIDYIKTHKIQERAGRLQDKEQIMERLRKLGYF